MMKKVFSGLVLVLMLQCLVAARSGNGRGRPRLRCPTPDSVAHGTYTLKKQNMLMRVNCTSGYTLQGPRIVDCVHGKWYGERPVCAKKGCLSKPGVPENGLVLFENEFKAVLYCESEYILAGNRWTYCNGSHWDRPLGECRKRTNALQYGCDFETEDICGWVHEPIEFLEWKRVTAVDKFTSYQTGPRRDHTINGASGGHFMLMESGVNVEVPIPLISPIYSRSLSLATACCFRFYYFMYGAGVGDLYVYVKPVTLDIEELFLENDKYAKFHKTGNQNNLWNEAEFDIEEMETDFQIVFVATDGKSHLSDIAIDDVKLMVGEECRSYKEKRRQDALESEEVEATSEMTISDAQSCDGRCGEPARTLVELYKGKWMLRCSCNDECDYLDNCCPDYRAVCLDAMFAQAPTGDDSDTDTFYTTPLPDESSPFMYTTFKNPPTVTTTTSTTTTTTTKKPTTTTTKKPTTTTTKKPTTAKSSTVRVTTPTTTTTTTAKPMTTTRRTVPLTSTRRANTSTVRIIPPNRITTRTTPTTTSRRTTPTSTTSSSPRPTAAIDAKDYDIQNLPVIQIPRRAEVNATSPQSTQISRLKVQQSTLRETSSPYMAFILVRVSILILIVGTLFLHRQLYGLIKKVKTKCQRSTGSGGSSESGDTATDSIVANFSTRTEQQTSSNALSTVAIVKSNWIDKIMKPKYKGDMASPLVEAENSDTEDQFGRTTSL